MNTFGVYKVFGGVLKCSIVLYQDRHNICSGLGGNVCEYMIWYIELFTVHKQQLDLKILITLFFNCGRGVQNLTRLEKI